MIKTLGQAVLTALIVVGILFVTGLVGGNQSAGVGGSRFPNGLSADGTEPATGEVRGTTFTSTGLATFASLSSSGAVTVTGTLGYRELSEEITASNTIVATESGKVFYLSGAASTSTLPAVATATGTVFRFVVAGSVTGDITIVSAEGDNLEGALDVNSSITTVDAADRILINQTAENLGDIVTVRSNGQKWFVTGEALNATGLSSDG